MYYFNLFRLEIEGKKGFLKIKSKRKQESTLLRVKDASPRRNKKEDGGGKESYKNNTHTLLVYMFDFDFDFFFFCMTLLGIYE